MITQKDKQLHFFISFILVIGLFFIFANIAYSVFIALLLGLLKELLDKYVLKGKFSYLDIVADVLGALAAATLLGVAKI